MATAPAARRRFHRLAKVDDKVTVVGKGGHADYPNGTVGIVVDILNGACGPIVAVQFPRLPGRTIDLFWKKVQIAK